MSIKEFANYAIKLSEKSEKNSFETFLDKVDTLFANDASLRGDLAHTCLYLLSAGGHAWSLNHLSETIVHFQDYLRDEEILKVSPDEQLEKQSLTHFIHRVHENTRDNAEAQKRKLGWVFAFILGVAVVDGVKFASHYINQETGQISDLLDWLYGCLAQEECCFGTLLDSVEKFESRRDQKKEKPHDFAVMLELGDLDPDSLWKPIFKQDALGPAVYRTQPSQERHFMFYRYSTTGPVNQIIKSFFVIQSPGLVKNRTMDNIRHQFAFKLFYQTDSGEIRRSTGGVYKLGSVVTFYGGSRYYQEDENPADISRSAQELLGPKEMTINFDCFGHDRPILGGVVTSMNEDQKPIATRFICVETHITHSDEAGIGSHSADDMMKCDEFGKFTIFGQPRDKGGRFIKPEDREKMFKSMKHLLRGEGKSHVTPPRSDELTIRAMQRQRS